MDILGNQPQGQPQDHDDPLAGDALYRLLGAQGFDRLTQRFYHAVENDPLLGTMYRRHLAQEHGLDESDRQALAPLMEQARLRLRDFLIQRFGGPDDYGRRRGHPRLRMRHMAFPIDHAAAERWLELMFASLDGLGLPAAEDRALRTYFVQTALFMVNRSSSDSPR